MDNFSFELVREDLYYQIYFCAKDQILFGEALVEQARIIKHCLDQFCLASEQWVSLHKSMVSSPKIPMNK